MPKCDFTLDFTGTAEDLVAKLKSEIESHNGTFDKDTATFSIKIFLFGKITGSYVISGQQIRILIGQKPGSITCDQIEEKTKEFIN